MQVVHDERVDEIIVSTFPGERSGWLRRDLVGRLRTDAGVPVEHVVADASDGTEVDGMSAHAETAPRREATTTATTGRRPRTGARGIDPTTLGMFLFIGSEAMLFGAFFTAYFFVRVVNPLAPRELAARAVRRSRSSSRP